MLATQAILCATLIGNAILFVAALKERPSLIRSVFAVYIALIFGWALTIFLNLFLSSTYVEEWIFAIAAGMLTAQFWFAKLFPDRNPPPRLSSYWSLLLGCAFSLASFYPGALFTAITIHPQGYTTLDSGPLSVWYSLFALAYACAPTFILFRTYRKEKNAQKRVQARHMAIGFSIFMVLAVSTNSILPVFFHLYIFNAIGPALSLIFAGFVFYGCWKHEFLDIRKVALRGVVYSFVIGGVLAADTLLMAATERYLESIRIFTWIHADDVIDPLTGMIVTAAGIVSAPFIERYFQKATDRLFFKDGYDYALALESLSAVLSENVDFDALLSRIREELARILRAESVDVVFYDDTRAQLRGGLLRESRPRKTLSAPIRIDGEEIGYIAVGRKNSGDKYRRGDERLLRTFALQASTALARAKLFMQVRKHAEELEQKVAERTEELRRARESERQTMLDIAHGLQTPLAVLQTKLERLRPTKEGREGIAAIEHSFRELSGFVADLLKLAHIEHAAIDRAELDLSALVADLCDEADIITQPLGIRLTRSIQPSVTARADERELRLALMNLIANSVKYMRPDGTRSIQVELSANDREATILIRDSGIGISPGDLPHIFDRFYRSGASAPRSGSGLGLAITKAIIERHGGEIGAQGAVDAGTVMTVQLPASNRKTAA